MDEDDDMLSAMARELAEKNGIGETVDNVWRAPTREHQKLFPASAALYHQLTRKLRPHCRSAPALDQPI